MTLDPTGSVTPVALAATGVTKTFGATQALNNVDLRIERGEIHALLGGNGSGKSTLIRILAGVDRADAGSIQRGTERRLLATWTPADARENGLHFVHQDPAIFAGLTVAENLCLARGFETSRLGRISWRRARHRAAEVLERFQLGVAPEALVDTLRPAERTMLAIARALQDEDEDSAGVLVLDEPTASLPVHEVDVLLTALRRHAARGGTILYVSHRLPEILSVASHATVLRDGQLAGKRSLAGATEADLVEMIVGRPLDNYYPAPHSDTRGEARVSVRNLAAGPLRGVDLDVNAGEILGVGGLLGAGRTSLLRAIFGDLKRSSGETTIDSEAVNASSPREAMKAGIALVPEDRGKEALLPTMTVRENLSAAVLGSYWRGLRLRHRDEQRDALDIVHASGVVPPRDHLPVAALSGGNAQKVVIARWLRTNPRLLLLDEPTQGVDVGARLAIYEQVRAAADAGVAVILVSSDFNELAHLSDRVLILRRGRISHELNKPVEPNRLTEMCLASDDGATL